MRIILVALWLFAGQAVAQQRVALELVLAIDTSTSVDAEEFLLQREGLAQAFEHPDVLAAITALGGAGIAVQIIAWAGEGQQRVAVPWQLVRDLATAREFAASIRAAPRRMRGFTDIAGAIRFAAASFLGNGFEGARQVIDVSGDGTASAADPSFQRDLALARGITINGLVILNEEIDLGTLADQIIIEHYRDSVIGGLGAFVMVADSFEDFPDAIRRKLTREIRGVMVAGRPVVFAGRN
jgi:uncharacterized protein DUF1194